MPEDHLPCGHCGFHGPIEYKDTVLLKREEEEVLGHGVVEGAHSVGVWVCPVCEEPTVWFWVYFDHVNKDVGERRLYPTVRDNNAVPSKATSCTSRRSRRWRSTSTRTDSPRSPF